MKSYMTVTEVAERLEVSRGAVRRWLLKGQLKAEKIERTVWLIEEQDLLNFTPPKRGRPAKER